MNNLDNIAILVKLTDNEINFQDLTTAFPLCQVSSSLKFKFLSILSPSSLDLSWFFSPESSNCPNTSLRGFIMLSRGLRKYAITETSPEIRLLIAEISDSRMQKCKYGDVDSCLAVLDVLCRCWRIKNVEPGFNCDDSSEIESDYMGEDPNFGVLVTFILEKYIHFVGLDQQSVFTYTAAEIIETRSEIKVIRVFKEVESDIGMYHKNAMLGSYL